MKSRLFLAILMAGSSLFAMPAIADEGNWMVRGRIITTVPDEGATLSTRGMVFPGSVDISNQVMPELDITHFFTKNIAAELILAVTPHDVTSTKVSVGDVLLDADVPLGDTLLLPPTLTLQYHFDTGTRFKPYVGGGVNLTFFLTEDEGDIADSIEYETSVGWAAQVGFDFDLDGEPGGWLFNADVKRIWLDTDVTVDLTSALGPALGAESVIVDAEVDIDPWIFGVGFGYRF